MTAAPQGADDVSMMKCRNIVVAYGAASYLVFLAAFSYAVAFVGGFGVPRTVDRGLDAPIGEALVVNLALLGLFGRSTA